MLPPTTVETEAISSVKEKMDTLINVRRFTHDKLARYNPNFDLFQVPDFLEEMACILLLPGTRPPNRTTGWDIEVDGFKVEIKSSSLLPKYLMSNGVEMPERFQFSNLQGRTGKGKKDADLFVFVAYMPHTSDYDTNPQFSDFWCLVVPKVIIGGSPKVPLFTHRNTRGKPSKWFCVKVKLEALTEAVHLAGSFQRNPPSIPGPKKSKQANPMLTEFGRILASGGCSSPFGPVVG